jgi:hypothetical protein
VREGGRHSVIIQTLENRDVARASGLIVRGLVPRVVLDRVSSSSPAVPATDTRAYQLLARLFKDDSFLW